MPTYEYECQGCGHRFELFQKITAEPIKNCPKCKKDSAKRLISAGAGFIFKSKGAPKCDMAGTKGECSSCPGSSK